MIVGEAHIIVRAITSSVRRDIKNGFKDVDSIGKDAGKNISDGLSRGMSGGGGGGGFFASLAGQAQGARASFDALITSAYTLGPGLALVLGAVSSLVGAFAGLAATAAGAVPSLIALVGVFAAVAAAAVTLKLAFMGVGEAIGAGLNAKSAGGGAKAVAKDLTTYFRRIADARMALAKTYWESNKAIEAAERKLSDAQKNYTDVQLENTERLYEAQDNYNKAVLDGAEDISDAQGRLAEVEARSARSISNAKAKVQEAQENLNKAFEAGREEIQQLKFAAEGAVLSEKKAALELEKAREKLLRVQDVPPNSRIRKEAELAFAQADLNYRKAIDTNADMAKEQDRLNKEGVDGTDSVVSAKKNLSSAVQDQSDAEIDATNDIAEAKLNLARVERDAATAILRAQIDKQKAAKEGADAEIAALAKIDDARKNLQEVVIARSKAQYDAHLALARALEDLEKAKKAGNASGAAGANAYANQLAKLSKEQRKFVRYMVDTFIPSIDTLRNAAAKKFFPKLIPALENLRTNLFPALKPLLTETGSVLGTIAQQISGTLTSPAFLAGLTAIWSNINSTILPGLGNIGSNVILGVTNVLKAAQPLTTRFVTYLDKISESFSKMFDTEGENKKLEIFFNKAGSIAAEIGGIIGDFFSGIGTIIGSQMEPDSGGFVMLRFLRDGAAAFKDFTKSPEGIKRIEDFFKNTANNAKPILGFIGDLVKEFLKLGENPNIGKFFTTLKESDFVGTLGDIANALADSGPAIAEFAASFAEFARATLESEAINVFYKTFTTIFDALTSIFESPAVKAIAPTVASIAAAGVAMRVSWKLLKIPILGITEPFFKLGAAIKKGLSPTILEDGTKKLGILTRAIALLGGTGPVAIAIAVIAGLVLAFVAMWNESEIFRNAIKNLIDGVITKAITIFETLKGKLEEALAPLGGMEGTVDLLKTAFKFLGDILGTYVIPFFEAGLKNALDIIGAILGTIIDYIGNLIAAFMKIFDGIKTGDVGKIFEGIRDAIFAPFEALWTNLVDLFTNIFNNVVEAVKSVFGIASPSKVFGDIAQAIIDGLMAILGTIVDIALAPFRLLITGVQTLFNGLTSFFTNVVKPLIDTFFTGISTAVTTVKDAIVVVFQKIKDTIVTVVNFLVTIVLVTAKTFFNGVKSAAGFLLDKINSVFPGIKTVITTVADFLKNTIQVNITNFFNNIKTGAGTLLTGISTAFNAIKSVIQTVASAVKTALSGLWNGLSSGLAAAVSTVKSTLRPAFKFIVDTVNNLRKIPVVGGLLPSLSMPSWMAAGAEGAIVTRPTIALIGEAGPEALIPLHKMPGSSPVPDLSGTSGTSSKNDITINVYPSPGMDEVELASLISREISFMMRKGSV
jgi:phage-related protein